ncbi:MAG TPA: glucose-6-phosphate dehydrogenase [Kouleothrix sp.]|uniref:glucose-6-phosphate dehydrogenase n=1 Tax=Kouleothrix sp. TaxID=2779161 RepID=UPI002CD74E3B|nr:glucose-6-phosphate dehydrogenase [Kouleothrix sp.]HRC76308.1 glucose-6-phosphate dehydrogenase [Kouleothrix sp.]
MTDTVSIANPLRAGMRMQRTPEPCTVVIFGATGDLTHRKLVPALYNLQRERLLPPGFSVVGFARRAWSDEFFRESLLNEAKEFSRSGVEPTLWETFAEGVSYVQSSFDDPAGYAALAARLNELDERRGASGNRLFYLSTPPESYATIIQQLGAAGLARSPGDGWTRIIIEKPFGRDLAGARALNAEVHKVFDERQVYRIDHYLGKETVQNILVFRFANGIFEPLWDRRYVDHVQITVAETVGLEGRGGYYEHAGAMRDMVQNHLMQLLTLTAMEPPIGYRADAVRDEKVKVLRAIRAVAPEQVEQFTVRGQYGAGSIGGEPVPGYRQEEGVAPESGTETYVALQFFVDNWRWAGVPFLLRTGKRLPKRVSEIAIQFRSAPLMLFEGGPLSDIEPNVLAMQVQPDEGITLRFDSKVPGQANQIRPVTMDFRYNAAFGVESPEAYERLLLDAMLGDSTLFTRSDEVEASWSLITPIHQGWANAAPPAFPNYEAGTWGPKEADRLLGKEWRAWRRL